MRETETSYHSNNELKLNEAPPKYPRKKRRMDGLMGSKDLLASDARTAANAACTHACIVL